LLPAKRRDYVYQLEQMARRRQNEKEKIAQAKLKE